MQNLDSGPGFPTDSLYGQLLFTLEEKPLGNGITVMLSILRAPPYTDLNPFYVKKKKKPESFLMHISKKMDQPDHGQLRISVAIMENFGSPQI